MWNYFVAVREFVPISRYVNEAVIAKDQTFPHYLRTGLSPKVSNCVFRQYATTEGASFCRCDNYVGLKLILTFGCFRKLRSENETNAKGKYNAQQDKYNAQDERETR
jgi:hypothetical protein